MKKMILFTLLILTTYLPGTFAADSTGTPEGTAKQSDQDIKGANITGVGELGASQVTTETVTASGDVSGGSVTTPGTVSAGTISAPAGAITNLNTSKVFVQSAPAGGLDATNKDYVDGQDSNLQSQINTLDTKVESLSSGGGGGVVASVTVDFPYSYSLYYDVARPRILSSSGLNISFSVVKKQMYVDSRYVHLRASFPARAYCPAATVQVVNYPGYAVGSFQYFTSLDGGSNIGTGVDGSGNLTIVKKNPGYIDILIPYAQKPGIGRCSNTYITKCQPPVVRIVLME